MLAHGTDHAAVLIPKEIRDQIPKEFYQDAYTRSEPYTQSVIEWFFESDSEQGVIQRLKKLPGITPARIKHLQKSIYKYSGYYAIPIAPSTWNDFPKKFRQIYSASEFSLGVEHSGLLLALKYGKSDNLEEIAKKYSAPNEVKKNLELLKKELGSRTEVSIPLEEILPPFVRKNGNTYCVKLGPNCHNASLNAGGYKLGPTMSTNEELITSLEHNYRYVHPHESLKAKDILVYFDQDGYPLHSSWYIDNGIVFTKNGAAQVNPYIFQHQSLNEDLYRNLMGFHTLSVYRPVQEGEKSIAAELGDVHKRVIYKNEETAQSGIQCLFGILK